RSAYSPAPCVTTSPPSPSRSTREQASNGATCYRAGTWGSIFATRRTWPGTTCCPATRQAAATTASTRYRPSPCPSAAASEKPQQLAQMPLLGLQAAGVAHHRRQLRGELLPQLHPPLIERIDPPHHALHEHFVLVKRDQLAERRGIG